MKSLILSAFLGAAILVGCSTSQSTVYKTVGTTIVGVDLAMSEWGAYVASQHPPVSQEQAVKAAYEKYQVSMSVVCDAGAIYAGSASTNSTAASGALQTAILNSSQSISDLENLITSFGVTLK